MITVLIFIGTLAFLIVIHEWGHFAVAKWAGVWVHRFAVGFGPKLWSYQGKETEYSIRALPFGGYVQMAGEDSQGNERDASIPEDRRFYKKSPLQRMAIVSAGPLMNLIAAVVIMIAVAGAIGVPFIEVTDFTENSPAASKLQVGDRIVRVDGREIYFTDQLQGIIQSRGAEPLEVVVQRGDEQLTFTIQPRWFPDQGRYLIGIVFPVPAIATTNEIRGLDEDAFLKAQGLRAGDRIVSIGDQPVISYLSNFIPAVEVALEESRMLELEILREDRVIPQTIDLSTAALTLEEVLDGTRPVIATRRSGFIDSFSVGFAQIRATFSALSRGVRGIFGGEIRPGEAVGGPIEIARLLGRGFNQGALIFFTLVAFLSLNLGLINLIPFPALDGSRIVFILYEMVRGRPIPPQREGLVHYIGFIILIGLMLLITFKDILRLLPGR
ncbi:MAG: RIP metalloprotease RseP [Candidatus Bipolaricaulia bacterium]